MFSGSIFAVWSCPFFQASLFCRLPHSGHWEFKTEANATHSCPEEAPYQGETTVTSLQSRGGDRRHQSGPQLPATSLATWLLSLLTRGGRRCLGPGAPLPLLGALRPPLSASLLLQEPSCRLLRVAVPLIWKMCRNPPPPSGCLSWVVSLHLPCICLLAPRLP